MEQLRSAGPPCRGRRRPPGPAAGEVAEPDRRHWLDAPARRRSRRWPGFGRASRCPTSSRSTGCFASRPVRRPLDAASRTRPRASMRCSPAPARWRRGSPPRTRPGPSRRSASRTVMDGARPAVPRPRRAPCSGCPQGEDLTRHARPRPAVDRLQLVRRRLPLPRRHQPRPAAAAAGPARRRRPRDLPGPPPRARPQGGRSLVEGAGPAGGERPPDQHARVPGLGGPRESRAGRVVPRPASAPTCWSSWPRSPGIPLAAIAARSARPRHARARSRRRARSLTRPGSTPRSCSTRTAWRATTCWTSSSRWAVSRRRPPRSGSQFIEHPLWRTYVFVYSEGEALLRRWLDVVPISPASGTLRPPAPGAPDAPGDRGRDRCRDLTAGWSGRLRPQRTRSAAIAPRRQGRPADPRRRSAARCSPSRPRTPFCTVMATTQSTRIPPAIAQPPSTATRDRSRPGRRDPRRPAPPDEPRAR